jgi:hypothetical protein
MPVVEGSAAKRGSVAMKHLTSFGRQPCGPKDGRSAVSIICIVAYRPGKRPRPTSSVEPNATSSSMSGPSRGGGDYAGRLIVDHPAEMTVLWPQGVVRSGYAVGEPPSCR